MENLKKCIICQKADDDSIDYGEFLTKKNITVHYFCLLLSTNLPQLGKDTGGILGFQLKDISREAKNATKRICRYCLEAGASVKCKKCPVYFHLICGCKENCLFEFEDSFDSYCHEHSLQNISHKKPHDENAGCYVCREKMGKYNAITSITAKCCNVYWSHARCIKTYALTAGYYTKCIWCGSEQFRSDIRKQGIFVPNRDALWEKDKSNFVGLYKGHKRCDMKDCQSLNGREYTKGAKWNIIVCNACGSYGAHKACLQSKSTDFNNFMCPTCKEILNRTQLENLLQKSKGKYKSLLNGAHKVTECDSVSCKCPFGKEYKEQEWNLVICSVCDNFALHELCINDKISSADIKNNFICDFCKSTLNKGTIIDKNQQHNTFELDTTLYLSKTLNPFLRTGSLSLFNPKDIEESDNEENENNICKEPLKVSVPNKIVKNHENNQPNREQDKDNTTSMIRTTPSAEPISNVTLEEKPDIISLPNNKNKIESRPVINFEDIKVKLISKEGLLLLYPAEKINNMGNCSILKDEKLRAVEEKISDAKDCCNLKSVIAKLIENKYGDCIELTDSD